MGPREDRVRRPCGAGAPLTEYVWRPAEELTAPWKPDGVPELGGMWYREGVRTDGTPAGEAAVHAHWRPGLMQETPHARMLWPAVKAALPPPLPKSLGRAEARRLRQMQRAADGRRGAAA